MKKWILPLSILTCLTSLQGWQGQQYFSTEQPSTPMNFPLAPDQRAFTEVSYLLWKPYERDLDFGLKNATISSVGNSPVEFKLKLEKPNFEWDSGVRAGIGTYLPKHDAWDISAYMTYFYGEASKHTHANFGHQESIVPAFRDPLFAIPSSKSSAHWKLNFFTWDLSFGRLFNLPYSITIHPYAGLRGALVDQDYRTRSFGQFLPNPPFQIEGTTQTLHFKASSEFWGVGPRVGSNFAFAFGKHWSILGNIAASILYGHYKVKEKRNADSILLVIANPDFTITTTDTLKAKDHGYVIRPNLEGSLGLGWESWVRHHTVRIAPSIALETSIWFAMNQFFELISDATSQPVLNTQIPEYETVRRHGNLVFSGFTFNFQVDF